MAWVESHSPSFSARYDSDHTEEAAVGAGGARGAARRARRPLRARPRRDGGRAPPAPDRARARPPLAAARPARGRPRRPALLRRLVRRVRHPRARPCARSRSAPRACPARARPCCSRPQHEYAHLVVGANNPYLPAALLDRHLPPLRALGLAVRGRRHLAVGPGAPAARRDRAAPARGRPAGLPARARATRCCSAARSSPCSSRSTAPAAAAALATSDLERGPRSVLVDAFGRQLAGVERDWRELLDALRAS